MKKYFTIVFLVCALFSINAVAEEQSLKIVPKENIQKEKQDLDSAKSGVHVADIYVACKYYFSKMFNTRENVSRKNICNGYFFGSTSMLLLLQKEDVETDTCIPMDVSTEEIVRGFLDWADKNQDKNKMLASEALLEILRNNYPCREYNPEKKKDKIEPKAGG